MKPIHHALVSSRLFGGDPLVYEPVHSAFDASKGAVADMRHRAALHSVDHGAAVMARIFPERLTTGARLADVCVQHVVDDQGFEVRLEDWLKECALPDFAALKRQADPALAPFLEDPAEAAAARWGGMACDYAPLVAYYRLPETATDHPLAPAIALNAFAIMFSERLFGAAITVAHRGRSRFVATRELGETLALARYGRIPTLAEVLQGMRKRDWMLGARVARSRRAREIRAGDADLFSEEMVGATAA